MVDQASIQFERLLTKPLQISGSFFLFGPRGTGKTTWLEHHFPDALFINLLMGEYLRPLSAKSERLRKIVTSSHADCVIIDEIQRVPELLNEVHYLIESASLQFILTGSSARKLRRQGVNLLAGRARTFHMHPLIKLEQEAAFDPQASLNYGNLPARFSDPDPGSYLQDYVQTYLREEVMQEALTRNIGNFSRFLEVASFSQGQTLNISEVAREAEVSRPMAENYFSILEDLLIAVRLPVFSRRAKRNVISQHKFYYFDAGVFRTIRPTGPLDSSTEVDGPTLETLVLQEMRAINDYLGCGYQIYFWRTKNGLEVDFVLYGQRGLLAIEVKRSAHIGPKDMRSLREFKKDYPPARCFIVYGGSIPQYLDEITALPIEQALEKMPQLLSGE